MGVCGEKRSVVRKAVIISVVVVVVIAAIVASVVLYTTSREPISTPTPTPTSTPTPTPTPTCEAGVICVTAQQLCGDYDDNEIAADHEYKGEILEVSGTIGRIGRGFGFDELFLTLDCGLISDVLTDVWCYFDKADEDKLLDIEDGDYVAVRGECTGKGLLHPSLVHCTSVQVVAAPDDGDDGWCFIATAAYGSYLDSHVDVLREFRDSYLMKNPVGRGLVTVYYRLSPPVAQLIDDHPSLKPIVRAGLWPAVALSTVAVSTTLAQKIAIVGGLALVFYTLVLWLKRQALRRLTG